MPSTNGGKKLIALGAVALSLFVPFILCNPHTSGAETVVVNKAFNGREIKVRAGGMICIELEELGSAGYSWAIKDLDPEHFEVVRNQTKDAPPQSYVTGVPVVKSWLILTRNRGKAVLNFLHYRLWEGEKNASDTFMLKVRIL